MSQFGTLLKLSILSFIFVSASNASAARGGFSLGGGGNSFGIVGGVSNSSQDQMNTLMSRSNSRSGAGPINTPAMNSAYELGVQYGYRFSGTIFEFLLRPTYFYQKSSGSGANGSYNYGVTGFTVFPMMRLYPLENDFMKFFMQLGLGYGRADSSIEENDANLTAVGDAFGTTVGMGAEFCITGSQCISLEANYRYLTMTRNIATDATATSTWDSGSVSQAEKNKEVEIDSDDMAVRMSGLQFLIGYIIRF